MSTRLGHLEQLDDQERNVVVRADVRRDLLEDAVGERCGCERGGGSDDRREQVDAGVDAPAPALDETVGVGHKRRARGQLDRGLADRRSLDVAERRGEGMLETRHPAALPSTSSDGGWPAEA